MVAIKTGDVQITIKLFGVFRTARFLQEVRAYPDGTTVADVVRDLGLPEHLLGIVVIDGVHASTADILQDGATLALLPLLDGG